MVPKNSGLRSYRESALSYFKDVKDTRLIEARGEDIPFLVKQFLNKGKNAFGLTGEDLFREYCLENKESQLKVIKRIAWDDPSAIYGKPTLCLIGPEGKSLETMPRDLTVCIASKYKKLAKKYLNFLERKGFSFKKIYINGCVETSCSEGIADLIIDIVYTGSSLIKYNLKAYDVIMQSDFLVIGADSSGNSIMPKEAVQKMSKYEPPTSDRRGKLRLDFNENTSGCSPKVLDALRDISVEDICMYPDYGNFRKELALYLDTGSKNVLPTNGTDEAIKVVMDTFLEKGDEVIIPEPTFTMFKVYADIVEANITNVLYNDDLSFPTQKLLEKITDKTKLVVLVNPNNPTGTTISEQDIISVLEKAKDAIVLVDEAYSQYYGKSCKGFVEKYSNLIVTQTFSKAFGLAGLRLGCIISSEAIITNLEKVISPYSVNNLALIAASAAMKDEEFISNYVEEVRESRQYVQKELEKLGIKVFSSEANFMMADFGERCNYVLLQLRERGILVRDRSTYPLLKNCIRIGIGTMEQSRVLIEAIKNIIPEDVELFDMDGVLVDVSNSYRTAIQRTAKFFANVEISREEIQEFKEKGGYNNDWDLTEAVILKRNVKCSKDDIIRKFQEFYLGDNEDKGLIDNERFLLTKEVLESLYKEARLGIVTGRPREEARYILEKFGMEQYFDTIIAMEDYPENKSKPDPCSISMALDRIGRSNAVYIGDSVDDMKAAKSAGIKAIGVIPSDTNSKSLKELLVKNGAIKVISDINQIPEVLK